MSSTDHSAALYAAALTLCVRHPSRRAAGFCERCRWDLCRECLLADHSCRAAPATPRPSRRWPRIAAGTIVGVVVLAVVSLWTAEPHTESVVPRPGEALTPSAPPPDALAPAATAAGGEAPRVSNRRPRHVAATKADGREKPVSGASTSTGVADVGGEQGTPPVDSAGPLPAAGPLPQESPATPAAPRTPVATAVSFNRGPRDRREVLLSFDGGAHATGAGEIIDTLSAAGVTTTFFLTGEFIRNQPALVRRLVAEGHEIGNHLDTHPHLTTWETNRRHHTRPEVHRAWLQAQLDTTANAFRQATGQELAPLWRAPYGEVNDDILRWAQEVGWQHIGWTRSLDSLDWVANPDSSIYRSADEIARRLVDLPHTDRRGGRGAIVLMHLGSDRPRPDRMARVLPQIIAAYRELGFEFVTASAMMRDS